MRHAPPDLSEVLASFARGRDVLDAGVLLVGD